MSADRRPPGIEPTLIQHIGHIARKAGVVLVLACLVAGMPRSVAPAGEAPTNVILMIADGCGPASMTLARTASGQPLAHDSILVGASDTRATGALITDSAAAATALATGVRTRNGFIGVDPERRPITTILEAAEARGMQTGLVATSRITHATPAAFAAHVPNRSQEPEIAVQMMDQEIEVVFGGGRKYFASGQDRKDGRDLLAEVRRRGVTLVTNLSGFRRSASKPVLALFAQDHMDYEIDRDPMVQPSLAEMTGKALELLRGAPRGFFVMVEGSRIDHAGHDNDPATHVRDLLAYDQALAVALRFAEQERRTLVVSVSDHETGGLGVGRRSEGFRPERLMKVRRSAREMALRIVAGANPESVLRVDAGIADLEPAELGRLRGQDRDVGRRQVAIVDALNRRSGVGWTTNGHTAVDVGLYAWGPGSERFRGALDHPSIGRTIASLMRLDLNAVTRRLESAGSGSKPR